MPHPNLFVRSVACTIGFYKSIQLRTFVASNAFKPGKPNRMNWDLNTEQGPEAAKAIRHNHLHLSLNPDATGMGLRYKNNNTLERHHEPG